MVAQRMIKHLRGQTGGEDHSGRVDEREKKEKKCLRTMTPIPSQIVL